VGRDFCLAANGEGLSSILYGFCPIMSREYLVKNVVLYRLFTDGSYLINKHISEEEVWSQLRRGTIV
jgi:hypothetical protein